MEKWRNLMNLQLKKKIAAPFLTDCFIKTITKRSLRKATNGMLHVSHPPIPQTCLKLHGRLH
jgi:hypothetical protein